LLYLKFCFLGDENKIKPEYTPSPLIQIRGRDAQKHTHKLLSQTRARNDSVAKKLRIQSKVCRGS
jgi:hypothetical protein